MTAFSFFMTSDSGDVGCRFSTYKIVCTFSSENLRRQARTPKNLLRLPDCCSSLRDNQGSGRLGRTDIGSRTTKSELPLEGNSWPAAGVPIPLCIRTSEHNPNRRKGVSMKRFTGSILVCLLALALQASAQTTNRQPTAPDNTKANKADHDQGRPTADQQKNNRSDTEITRDVRHAITSDKALSTYAKNVKVITQNGNVTLRGPVHSEEEKSAIEAKATEVAGPGHVKNELEIAAKQ